MSSLGEFLIGYVSIYFAIPRSVFRDLKVQDLMSSWFYMSVNEITGRRFEEKHLLPCYRGTNHDFTRKCNS